MIVGNLRTLARLSRLLAEQSFRAELRGCANPAAAQDLIAAFEKDLLN